MKTIKTRVREDHIRAESVMTDRPEWADDGWEANWYTVTLTRDMSAMGVRMRSQITVPYGMGPAYTDEPTAEMVLSSLLMDAASYENARSFEDWAEEYGYSPDSRKAERTYRQVEAQTTKLRKFLRGDFQEYVFNTETD